MAELRVLDRHRATRDGCPLGLPENGNASRGWRYSLLPQHHHRSFQPNCTWRDVVEVLVMAPAVPDKPVRWVAVGGVKTIRLGVLKLARSSGLKISARNCRLRRSRILVSFRTEKSQVPRPGPMCVSLPTFP
jgi:hypothetical protein